jgi:hypothetical protein
MQIQERRNWILRSDHWVKQNTNGPRKTQGNSRLASTTKPNWSAIISRVHRILSILRTKLFKDSMTTIRPHKEKPALALGSAPTWHVWRTKNKDVL